MKPSKGSRKKSNQDRSQKAQRINDARSRWASLQPLQAEPGITAVAGEVRTLSNYPLEAVTLHIGNQTCSGSGRRSATYPQCSPMGGRWIKWQIRGCSMDLSRSWYL